MHLFASAIGSIDGFNMHILRRTLLELELEQYEHIGYLTSGATLSSWDAQK